MKAVVLNSLDTPPVVRDDRTAVDALEAGGRAASPFVAAGDGPGGEALQALGTRHTQGKLAIRIE